MQKGRRVKPHKRLLRWTLCLFGHRGETWWRVERGAERRRLDICTRCGVRVKKGRVTL